MVSPFSPSSCPVTTVIYTLSLHDALPIFTPTILAVEERGGQAEEVSAGLVGCGEPGGPRDHTDPVGGAVQRRARVVPDGFTYRRLDLCAGGVLRGRAGGLRWSGHVYEQHDQRQFVAGVALQRLGPFGDLAAE